MEIYQLRYFLEAARHRNFTRAAAKLHVAQPALSEQIRKLESELGAVLFERGRRESTLTAAGESLRVHAEEILRRTEEAQRAVQDLVGVKGGRLVIGAIPSVSAGLLPKAVGIFRRNHPGVDLVLAEGTSEAVADWVEAGKVAFGLVQLPADSHRFDAEVILSEAFVVLVSHEHRLNKRRQVDLSALAEEPFVFYKGRARETALAACHRAGFEPRVACESGELEAVHALVAAGLGIALLPELAGRRAAPECKVIKIHKPEVRRELAILTRRGHRLSPAGEAFRELLR